MVQSIKIVRAVVAAMFVGQSRSLTFAPRPALSASSALGVTCVGEIEAVRISPHLLRHENSPTSSMLRMASGPAVLDRPTVEKKTVKTPSKEKKRLGSDGWEVRIYNDGRNTREHVARCLVRVTGLSEVSAYETMMQAHQFGIAAVGIWMFERAEMYYEALKGNGIICDMVPVEKE